MIWNDLGFFLNGKRIARVTLSEKIFENVFHTIFGILYTFRILHFCDS